MAPEGRLSIVIERAANGHSRATIGSSRPLSVARVFTGKTAAEAVELVPILFNVCGLAQGAASAEAVERALGIEMNVRTRSARQLLVLAEIAREHLIRVISHWSRSVVSEEDAGLMLRVMRSTKALRSAADREGAALCVGSNVVPDARQLCVAINDLGKIIEEHVLREPLERFSERRTADTLADWYSTGATPAQRLFQMACEKGWTAAGHAETSFLPALPQSELIDVLFGDGSEEFIASPTWDGIPRETTSLGRQETHPLIKDLARRHGNGLVTRLAAQLVELASLPAIMADVAEGVSPRNSCGKISASTAKDGCGLSHVEAARGRLIHGVEVAAHSEKINRYAIVAPTEWNFHPDGITSRGLAAIGNTGGEDLLKVANLFIGTLDPCVGYQLRVH